MMNKYLLLIFPAVIIAVLLVMPTRFAHAYSNNDLIDDSVFDNSGSMSASQIDTWLNAHFPNSCISTNNGFTAPDPTGYSPDSNFVDGIWSYGSRVSAGRVIYDAAVAHSVNPQVLLTKLENEENLVTGNSGCATWRYASAVGYACTDSGTSTHNYTYTGASPYTNSGVLATPLYYHNGTAVNSIAGSCVNQNVKAGFSEQVVHAAWLLSFVRHKSEGQTNWAAVHGSWNHCEDNATCPAGDNIPTNWACYSGFMTQGYFKRCPSDPSTTYYDGYATIDGSSVHIDTGATAALYVYTPHFQSFDSIFSPWFGSPTGSTLFKVGSDPTYYLEWGGYYYPVPSTSMLQAYGLARIAPRTLSSLPSNETEGPALQRCVKFGSDISSDPDYTTTVDFVEGGVRHDAPNWSTLNSYGYSSYINLPASLYWALGSGDGLRPVVKVPNGAIYLMDTAKKRLFPDLTTYSTLSGPNYAGTTQVYSQQQLTRVSSEFISSVSEGAPLLLDGKFIQPSGGTAIYLYDSGKKYMFSPDSYQAWGKQLDYRFTSTAVSQIADGGSVPILISSSGGANYLADSGLKKIYSASTQSAWGLNNTQFTPMTDRSLARLASSKVLNLIKGPDATVYQIGSGAKHPIPSLADFYGLGFSWSGVDTVDNATLAQLSTGPLLFVPGAIVREPNGAVFIINSGYEALGVTSSTLFNRFGLLWGSVRNIGSTTLNGYAMNNLQTLLKSNSDGSYYEIENGVKHYASTNAYGASEYNMSSWPFNSVDSKVLNVIKTGPQLTQYLQGSGSTVFYIQNGQKRGITSSSEFYSLGGSWSKVVKVSDSFLSEIPTGASI